MSMRKFTFLQRDRQSKDIAETAVTPLGRTISSETDRLSRASTLVSDGAVDAKGPLGLSLLHAPSEPLFDLVFVHGLGGGSRKTWSKTNSISHHWPAEWLPRDPGFEAVRIHTYGYDSDWTKGNDNCLNIHHLGKSLLGELSTSPDVGDSNTALVLVGHSMGGLVIKKAYMLAHQENKSLADRIRAIYFLGTPHRGSDSARLLKNILQVASSAPAFVTELVRGSGALQSINDDFRQYSADVELWSFYETQKLRTGGLSTLIVDPESATLGYREEKQMPMNADHRSICKFDTPNDQNYIIIRNSLVFTFNRIATSQSKVIEESRRDSIESLAAYLGVTDDVEDDLITVQDARVPGTCEWILEKQYFTDWKHQQYDAPPILWVGGKPATGKSVLAGFVAEDIRRSDMACSYYFFKHGDNSKSRLSACLRSLAFQMAAADPGVRDMLLKLQEDRMRVDEENERSLWRTFFVSGVFGAATTSHCWVIDALDECTNFAPLLDSMLSKMDSKIQLRIFITSRETPELCRLFSSLGPRRHKQAHMSAEETLPDIERIVTAKGETFFTDSEESRAVLEKRIIEKSKGSFLWTLLVLDELSSAFSEEEIEHVLDEVPRGMEPLYHRALETMALATRGKKLAKAILTWTTCVKRPLALKELECALEIDLRDTFPRLKDTIRTLCGQLVTVDKHDRVQMVHETAREFLRDGELESEFAVNKTEAHTRIAKVCLEYLTGDELKPPRAGRRATNLSRPSKKSEFSTYASGMFSSHLARADPAEDHLLTLVDKFLRLNILTWIENVAETKSLGLMIRAAEDLKTYASSCMVERSPLRRDIQGVRSWSIDLQRVAAKFADALITSPSAIYSRIPPFCPTNSAIHSIPTPSKRLAVVGLPALPWDDRLSCLDFGGGQTSALCYGEEFLAVGLRGGRVALYHPNSCQEYRSLSHGETVMHLRFREKSDMLASSGSKSIRVWDIRTGQQLHQLSPPRRCIGLVFYDNLLMAASNQNEFFSWDLEDEASQQDKNPWRDWMDDGSQFPNRPPSALSIAVAHRIMAVAYTGMPVTIWDLEQDEYLGSCGKKLPSGETSTHPVVALLLNPNPNIELLAISYLDGELVIIDPFADMEVEKQRVSCHTLAASPDGRLLAGGGGGGIIQIFEFDTLRLLYKVKTSDLFIKTLAFSHDGGSLADLRGSQCNIWTPPVLLAGASLDDDDFSVDTSNTVGELPDSATKVKVTAITLMPDKEGILCGQADGSVCLYDITTGDQTTKLYSHKAAVHTLCWLPLANTAMSTCLANGILAWSLEKSTHGTRNTWAAKSPVLDFRLDCGSTIVHLLPGEAGNFILSTHTSDHLWNLDTGKEVLSISHDHCPARVWLRHPQSPSHVICFEQQGVHIHRWRDLSEVTTVSLTGVDLTGLTVKGAFPCARTGGVLLDLTDADGSSGTKEVLLLDCASPADEHASTISSAEGAKGKSPPVTLKTALADKPDERKGSMKAAPVSLTRLGNIMGRISHVIGVTGTAKNSKLVFLDTRSWVCSIDLDEAGASRGLATSYTRHFFVPYDWFAGTRSPIGGVTNYGDVVFAKIGDIAVIKGGLDYAETVDVALAPGGSRGGKRYLPLRVPGPASSA